MAQRNKTYLFICQRDEGEITIETKQSVDLELSMSEAENEDIDFKVVGRICTDNLTLDFPSSRIEWYEPTLAENEALVGDAVIKIIQKLSNKYA